MILRYFGERSGGDGMAPSPANFRELREGELPRISIPRTQVNRGKKEEGRRV